MFSSTMLFGDQPFGKDLGQSKRAVLTSSRDGHAALVWPLFWLPALSWTFKTTPPRACWHPCTMCWIVAGLFQSMPLYAKKCCFFFKNGLLDPKWHQVPTACQTSILIPSQTLAQIMGWTCAVKLSGDAECHRDLHELSKSSVELPR